MWSLVTRRGQRVALRSLPAVLGSGQGEADVVLPHPAIAARHVRVEELDGGQALQITAIDGAELELDGQVTTSGRLSHGDELMLGPVALRAVSDAVTARAPEAVAPAADDELGELTVRTRAPPKTASGPSRGPAGGRPAAGRAREPAPRRPDADRRGDVLSYSRTSDRRGLLHADLSQLSGPVKGLLVCVLLLLAAGLVWGLSTLMVEAI